MPRRTLPLALVTLALSLAAIGCARGEEQLPPACTEGQDAFRAALKSAPRPVRLDGAAISTCMSEEADGAELQEVGISLVEAASRLATDARREPEGRSAVELGYLVAAAHRGGASTQGVHSELLRRLDQELGGVNTHSRAFQRGRRAGRATG